MKLHRLALTNVRGIELVDIPLAPAGITALYGRNEIGKSTMQLALRAAVNEKHTADNKVTRQLQTNANGEGPEVTFEFEVGGEKFRYSVRYFSKRTATLEYLTQAKTTLHKVDAFEEMQRLLGSELDIRLWTALSVLQGESTKGAGTDRGMIGKILDELAGDDDATGRHDDLWERIQSEHGRLLHDDGRLRDEHVRHESRMQQVDADLLSERRRIQATQESAATIDVQDKLQAMCRMKEREFVRQSKLLDEQILAASNLEAESIKATAAVEVQESKHREAARLLVLRGTLEDRLDEARKQARKAEKAAGDILDDAERKQVAQLDLEIEKASVDLRTTKDQLQLDANRLKHRRLERELAGLRDRVTQGDLKTQQIEQAHLFIRNAPTPAKAKAIKAASESLLAVRAKLDVDGGKFSVHAAKAGAITIDGSSLGLKAGQEEERALTGKHEIVVGTLSVRVTAGKDSRELQREADAAAEKLTTLLAEANLASPEAAHEDAARAKQLQKELPDLQEELKLIVRDLASVAGLRAQAAEWESRLAAFFAENDPLEIPSYDQLNQLVNSLTAQQDDQTELLAGLEIRRGSLSAKTQESAIKKATHQGASSEAGKQVQALTLELELAEHADAKNSLEANKAREEQTLAGVRRLALDLKGQLKAADVKGIKEMRESLVSSAKQSNTDARDAELKGAQIRAVLNKFYEDGSRKTLDGLEEESVELHDQVERTRQDAAAVGLLQKVMSKYRDEERDALLGPLTNRINTYCGLVFRRPTQVVLDPDSLQVSRIRRGANTIAWEDASGGTQEQISIIHRLACAKVAAEGGGVPVFFDDTLGYASPTRLAAMVAVLNASSSDLQLIVMSCDEARFAGLRLSKKVDMEIVCKVYDKGDVDEMDLLVIHR